MVDPKIIAASREKNGKKHVLDKVDACCLLSLRAEDPGRSNLDYINKLFVETGQLASSATITRFFNTQFPHKGWFCKPNLILLDKFKLENLLKFKIFYDVVNSLPDNRSSTLLIRCT